MKILSEFIRDCFANGIGNGNYIPSLSEYCIFETHGKFDNYEEIINSIINIIVSKLQDVLNAKTIEDVYKQMDKLLSHPILIKKDEIIHNVDVFKETLKEPKTLSEKLLLEEYVLEGKNYKTVKRPIRDIFFDLLCITFVKDKNSDTVYRPQNTLYNYDENTLSYIDIVFNINGDVNEWKRKLGHELTHAYNDLRMRELKSKTLMDVLDDTYKKSIEHLKNPKNAIEETIANFVKYFKKEEINANIAGFHASIEGKKLINVDDGVKLIKKTNIYKNYLDIADIIHKIHDNQYSKEIVKMFYDEFRKNGGYEGKTDNQIIKNVEDRVMRFFRKFNSVIPKMVFDEIEKRNS